MMNGASWQDAPELMKLGLTLFTIGAVVIAAVLWQIGWRKVAVLVFVAALAFVAGKAMARDLKGQYAGSPLKPWFDQLQSKSGGLCCSEADGQVLESDAWKSCNGHYCVLLEGAWREVRDDAVITEPNRFGRTMVWVHWQWDKDGKPIFVAIRCFMPGAQV